MPLILFTDPDLRSQFQRNGGETRSHSQIFPTTLLLMGYAGLLSLGHALFFAAGLYASGLACVYGDVPLPLAFA